MDRCICPALCRSRQTLEKNVLSWALAGTGSVLFTRQVAVQPTCQYTAHVCACALPLFVWRVRIRNAGNLRETILIFLCSLQVKSLQICSQFCVYISWHPLEIRKDRGEAYAVILWPPLICTNVVPDAVTRALGMMTVLRKDLVLFVTGSLIPRRIC